MFTKAQFFIALAVSAFIGFGVGYSKSRELCLQAIITATGESSKKTETE